MHSSHYILHPIRWPKRWPKHWLWLCLPITLAAQSLEPPIESQYGVRGFPKWEHIYYAMGHDRAWMEEQPEGGWERDDLLAEFLKGPMGSVEEIVFSIRRAGGDWHWYANFGYYANDANAVPYGEGAQLVVLNLKTGKTRVLLDDPQGTIRDPAVHYDGETILFSYRKGGSSSFNLYTIQSDGTRLSQLTHSEFDDIEPTWLPDGGIAFCSSRARRWVPCYTTPVAILYRCDADGSNLHPISSNVETENTPWMMPDGRLLYTRWEYVDRNQDLSYHHLWTVNPDGTSAMTYLGNQFAGILMIGAKPVPNSEKVVASVAPGHGRNEGTGAVALIDASLGPDNLSASRIVSRPEPIDRDERYGWVTDEHRWRDPYPFSEECFLVARNRDIMVMNGEGFYQKIYSLPDKWEWPATPGEKKVFMAHEPRPLVPRKSELKIPDRTDPGVATGTLFLADVTEGRSMEGVEPGQIHDLLVLEVLPKPINYFGGADIIATYPTYFLYRVLGSVPVEQDGSAYFELPALRPVFFVARDKNGNGIKRMRSFTSVMPGEISSCIGCHEERTHAPASNLSASLKAFQRLPSSIQPVEGTPEVFDFNRDIQPLFDKHCLECHSEEKPAGRLSFSGDRNNLYGQAYTQLFRRDILDDHQRLVEIRSTYGNLPAFSDGSYASPLIRYFQDHKDVHAPEDTLALLKLWIDAGAPYAGTYAALGSGMVGWRTAPEELLEANCMSCHGNVGKTTQWRKIFPEYAFNLTRPDLSLILRAPLAKEAGGLGWCVGEGAAGAVFPSVDVPDFIALRDNIREHARWAREDVTGYGFPEFRPSDGYIREMKRFGILPKSFDITVDPIRPYIWDQNYWRIFH